MRERIGKALGAGLAFGLGTKLGRSSAARRLNILYLEPLADRLDSIENRILHVETRFTTGAAMPRKAINRLIAICSGRI
ncbi:MAG: hypothetical protein M3Z23_04045 [Acidobacteriota bacterium]|nr:hypothetical protein [Acidobacteriota bacterium]